MKVEVHPSILSGSINAIPGKSLAQRVIACALLAKGETIIHRFPKSNDCLAALDMAKSLGAIVTLNGSTVSIKGGFPMNFQAGIRSPKKVLEAGESGLASRMFTPIAALWNEEVTVIGEGSLQLRPFFELEKALPQLGAQCTTTSGKLPLVVKGPLLGGHAVVDGKSSSQYLTGLLLALPKCSIESKLEVVGLNSKPYVDLTIEVAKFFGVKISHKHYKTFSIGASQSYTPKEITIGGDWSGAAFILVAAAIASEDGVTVNHLSKQFTQADQDIMEVLEKAGVDFVMEENAVTVKASAIQAFDFDATDCPDLFPPIAVLAAMSNGVCTITGAQRLIHKESNRAKSLQEEFAKAGIRIVVRGDEMKIYPGSVRKAVINSHNDHRIAMAAAVLALAGDKMVINGAECINKSYPHFFEDLALLGGRVK